MKAGEKIKLTFAHREIEGTVIKIFPNTVYLKTDFKNHSGKIIKRKLNRLNKNKRKK